MNWRTWFSLGLSALTAVPHSSFADEAAAAERRAMVATQIRDRGITDAKVLAAMEKVPRSEFVPADIRSAAHRDSPLPIGHGQTISQPYIVALMSDLLAVRKGMRILEIGTGSGYQAAILAELGAEVYSIEIIEPLARSARETLDRLGYNDVRTRAGDGFLGWPEAAPFDAIIVTCAPEDVPPALVDQLRDGGRMVIPVGAAGGNQELVVLEKHDGGVHRRTVAPVRFVPMVPGGG